MEWITKLMEIVKLPLRYSWVAAITSGLLLFLPDEALGPIHCKQFVQDYGTQIGLVFMVTSVIVVVELVMWCANGYHARAERRAANKRRAKALESLDPLEKAVLREFFVFQSSANTILLPVENPTVAGLLVNGILEMVSQIPRFSRAGRLVSVRIADDIMITQEMLDLPARPTEQEWQQLAASRPGFMMEIELFHR
jgi:hypothetical protein